MGDDLKQYEKLIELLQEAIQRDIELRKKYEVGEKFRFVRDRLRALLTANEAHVQSIQQIEKNIQQKKDETTKVPVYVYLYNAQGALLRNWITMLTPKVFYEYSVNRPV